VHGEEPEKGEWGEDVAARNEARRSRRLDSQGQLAPDALLRARQELESRALKTSGTLDAGIWNWEWLGPGNIGGRVRALVIHPTNPNWMWAATAGGGIWRTTNGGGGWFPMTDFMPALAVASLAIDPITPTTLYAGTGELVGSNSSIPGAGIFKSTNSGLTWTQLASTAGPNFQYVSHIEHHPAVSGRLLAGTLTGLWSSVDGGASWTRIFTPPNGAAVRDVKYNPSNFTVVAVGTATDMYLSVNGVAGPFDAQTTGAANKMPASPGDCAIEFARSNTNIIYVSAGKDVPVVNDLSDAIYRSSDGGQTWSWFMPTNADRWSNALWVSPTNPDHVVWGGFGDLYRTTNGLSYNQISDGSLYNAGLSAHTDQHHIVAHPSYDGATNKTVYFANDGGVQMTPDVLSVTTNSGWTNLANNLGCSQFFGAAISPDGTRLVGGMQDMGSWAVQTSGGVQAWTPVSGGDGIYAAVDFNNPQRLFVTAQFGWVGRSDDGGQTVVQKTTGLYGPGQGNQFDFLAPLVMDPNNASRLLLGGIVIWGTTNAGDNWSKLRDSLPGNPRCVAIDIARSNSNVIWIGYSNGLISHSEDGGATWLDHSIPGAPCLPNVTCVTDLAINPLAWNEVVVTMSGYNTDNVWLTNTSGASWQRRTGAAPDDLPGIQVNTVRYHPLLPNWIYVGTDLGVFASEDKGITWSVTPALGQNEGPNNVEVDELFWQGTTYLLAATHGRGVYRCKPLPIVYVDHAHVGYEDGSEVFPYNTVAEAVASYGAGAVISVKSGTYNEPTLLIDRRGTVRATNGSARIE
jgi:photosystem II stability/assembly factor-like uncharacterized protein